MIDFCFHSPHKITVLDYRILDDQYNGYVSDHYGIMVTAVVNVATVSPTNEMMYDGETE